MNLYMPFAGYEQFGKMRSDPALCFKALCGEEPPSMRKKNKSKAANATAGKVGGASVKGEDSEGSESGEDEDSDGEGESGPSTPATPSGGKRYEKQLVRSWYIHVYVLNLCCTYVHTVHIYCAIVVHSTG